jgi:two-component system CheB/CheR fusion protein
VPTPVLAVGASAGGLQALRAFLGGLPGDRGWTVVVVQHLQAGRESMLTSLLQPSTPWQVRQADDRTSLEAGVVLVVPAGQVACFEHRRLRLAPRAPGDAVGSIDHLLGSAAVAFGPHAVGVVLSGMGHDGTAGLRAVHAAGGLAAVQEPGDAEHAAMPASALASGVVDLVATAQHLPMRIASALAAGLGRATTRILATGGAAAAGAAGAGLEHLGPGATGIARIQQRMRAHGGQGFERYKPSTVRRRVERRMSLHGLDDIADYESLLDANPGEVELLFKEMMIGVTSFFRDPASWQILEQRVLPVIAAAAPSDIAARAWCAGCSTGQEAYSLAMAWRDAMSTCPAPRRLQIFASDLSAGAVACARAGVYKLADLEGVSAARRARYFVDEEGCARVSRELREMVLFARHDLTSDPPFGRLDLLMCRNVLIYLQSEQQQDLLRLFHHCLKPDGWLVLGLSETLGSAGELFQSVDGMPNLFRRRSPPPGRVAPRLFHAPSLPTALRDTEPMTEPEPRANTVIRQAERLILERFAPASILVSRDGDVVWTCGPTERYLGPADGRSNVNVLVQAGATLRVWLAGALSEALSPGSKGMELRGLRLPESGTNVFVDVSVTPLESTGGAGDLGLIVIRSTVPDAGDAATQALASSEGADALPEIRALGDTVRRLKEELQASSEDYQSANEELQSSNEELTTSREEMQSMNEELQAINAELRAKLDALALEQSDMKNLLDSTQIATLFLDEKLNVRRFTEQARQLVNLRDGDAGRPLSDLTTRLGNPGLVERAAEVLRTLVASEEEVPGPEGRWYTVRVLPYRTVDNVIAGVVITFTDTTRSDASKRGPHAPA